LVGALYGFYEYKLRQENSEQETPRPKSHPRRRTA
jgi:hypothetical protein